MTGLGGAAAQDAAYFSPTYAASQGSPYSEIYARAFGTPPLETAAPPPAATPRLVVPPAAAPDPTVVYVIENNRLLTYDAKDYARGKGQALAGTSLVPSAPPYGGPHPEVRVPTIADRLYAAPPLETAGGKPSGAPIPLLPQN